MFFSMFLLPKLKVDPEEYKRVMGSNGGSGGGGAGQLEGAGRGAGAGGARDRRD